MAATVGEAGLADGSRLRVGGAPGPEELAAVVAALDAAARADDVEGAANRRPSGWQRAARAEAVGAGRFRSAADVRSRRAGATGR
jgi:MoxR-like ATPase